MTLRRVLRTVVPLLALVVAGAASIPGAAAQTAANAPTLYQLSAQSGYEDGCFDPCLCPVHITDGLAGTLRLIPASPEPGYTVYKVDQVNWLVPGADLRVTGSGTYRMSTDTTRMQQLTLDLVIDGRPQQHFDSGLVMAGVGFPQIDITVSMNNLVCHDTVFHVSAAPMAARAVPYGLFGSKYLEGCFGPCDCAVASKPLQGRFGLVKIRGDNLGTDYAVIDVRWLVRQATTAPISDSYPVAGFGIYRYRPGGGITTVMPSQRMTLFLSEAGGAPVRFDSGIVPGGEPVSGGGPPRRIDVDLAANGFACTDRVYSLHARRGSSAVMDFGAIRVDPAPIPVTPVP